MKGRGKQVLYEIWCPLCLSVDWKTFYHIPGNARKFVVQGWCSGVDHQSKMQCAAMHRHALLVTNTFGFLGEIPNEDDDPLRAQIIPNWFGFALGAG